MPEHHTGYRTVGLPTCADLQDRFFRSARRQLFQPFHRIYGGQVADGEDVGSLQSEHEVYIYGPVADTLQADQCLAYCIIGHRR